MRYTKAQREIVRTLAVMHRRVLGVQYLLAEGRWFTPQTLPKGIHPAPLGLCFANAARLATRRPALRYCEGYATIALSTDGALFAAEHGWCIDEHDRVVDPTWCTANGSPGLAYLGIVITPDEWRDAKRRCERSALWDYRNRFPLVRQRQEGATR